MLPTKNYVDRPKTKSAIMLTKIGFFVCLFFSLSQHLDHLQQLDNLEHSAHLYGQLTTVGLFTTIWSCTTFELFRLN
jgi:hypothetical protein